MPAEDKATATAAAPAEASAAPAEAPATPAKATESATTDAVAAAVAAATAAVPSPAAIPTKVVPAVLRPDPPLDPNIPCDRDAVADVDRHKGTMLLMDLVRLHYYLWKKGQQPEAAKEDATETKEETKEESKKEEKPKEVKEEEPKAAPAPPAFKVDPPTDAKDVEELATRLTELFKSGRRYELSGLKDVPTPFFKGEGRFFEKTPTSDDEMDEKKKYKRLDDAGAKSYVSSLILKYFKEFAEADNKEVDTPPPAETEASAIAKAVDTLFENLKDIKTGEEARSDPRPYDVLFLPVSSDWEESMNYEHQSGNKNLLYLASQHVTNETKESISRIKASFALVTAKVQVSSGTELVTQNQRFVIQRKAADNATGQKLWKNMERDDLAEFATIFVFEVFLEKRFYEETMIGNSIVDNVGSPVTPGSTQAAMKDLLSPSDANKPSDVPIPNPTTHDVLFGRGGMTNGHPGNRRFRDIIALHRPDYVRATKMDKPNVARKIVRAIRQGNPAGRFLRKSADGMWRDVGDKVAAEKTSQGLRERSNAEKRQRSAMRESLRIGRDSLGGESTDGTPAGKKIKLNGGVAIGVGGALNGNIVPLTLTTKKSGGSAKKIKKGINGPDEDNATESLPPNAVDKDGNLLVTDHGTFETL
mmetsp:Transcript_21771/g.53983  ORF Transcript_21771/g.53983 Transcript_21771/m.53983 type:complete len:646 (-) Transcript_21771:771-2708(-)